MHLVHGPFVSASCVFSTSTEGNTPRGVPHRVQSNVDAAETPSDGLMPQSHLATLTSLHTVHITSYSNVFVLPFLFSCAYDVLTSYPCGHAVRVHASTSRHHMRKQAGDPTIISCMWRPPKPYHKREISFSTKQQTVGSPSSKL